MFPTLNYKTFVACKCALVGLCVQYHDRAPDDDATGWRRDHDHDDSAVLLRDTHTHHTTRMPHLICQSQIDTRRIVYPTHDRLDGSARWYSNSILFIGAF